MPFFYHLLLNRLVFFYGNVTETDFVRKLLAMSFELRAIRNVSEVQIMYVSQSG